MRAMLRRSVASRSNAQATARALEMQPLVSGEHRPTEAIVDPGRYHVDILTDAVLGCEAARSSRESEGFTIEEDMIVFHADRPVRGEADLDAGANGSAPTRVVGCVDECVGGRKGVEVSVVNDGRAALDVHQHVIPGVTHLACEQTEGTDPRVYGEV